MVAVASSPDDEANHWARPSRDGPPAPDFFHTVAPYVTSSAPATSSAATERRSPRGGLQIETALAVDRSSPYQCLDGAGERDSRRASSTSGRVERASRHLAGAARRRVSPPRRASTDANRRRGRLYLGLVEGARPGRSQGCAFGEQYYLLPSASFPVGLAVQSEGNRTHGADESTVGAAPRGRRRGGRERATPKVRRFSDGTYDTRAKCSGCLP